MKMQLAETYLSPYRWVKDGDVIDWPNQGTTYDGSMTTAVSAGEALVDVDLRADSDVVALAAAKKVIIRPKPGTVSLEFRFRSDGTAAGDQEILELHAAAGLDHYAYVDQLTIDRGTMEYSSTIFFYDTISAAGELWLTATSEVQDTNNRMGRYILNTHGYDRFCFIMTTKDANTTNLYIDWRRH